MEINNSKDHTTVVTSKKIIFFSTSASTLNTPTFWSIQQKNKKNIQYS